MSYVYSIITKITFLATFIMSIIMVLTSPLFLLLISIVPLISVYIAQFGFALEPCILCIYQRIPYFIIIGLNIIPFVFKQRWLRKTIIILTMLALLIEASIALYHVGVEKGVFTMDCQSTIDANNLEDLRQMLLKKPTVPCDKPQFVFLNISMAGWNFLYSGFLAMLLLFKSISTVYKKSFF